MNRLVRMLAWIAAVTAVGITTAKLFKKQEEKSTPAQGLKQSGTKTIETERLILRQFTSADAEPMFNNWASDPEVSKFLTWPTHQDLDDSREIVQKWEDAYQSERCSYNWAIVLKSLGEPIGSISVVKSVERTLRAEIGYCIGRAWWHQGIMTETLSAVIDYLFEEGYQRIEAMHDVNNPRSGDVMMKCGMQYEGTLRGYSWNNQGRCDLNIYSILREDYLKACK